MDLEHHETSLPGKSTLVSFLFFYMPLFPSSFPVFVLFLFNNLLSLSMFWMHGKKNTKPLKQILVNYCKLPFQSNFFLDQCNVKVGPAWAHLVPIRFSVGTFLSPGCRNVFSEVQTRRYKTVQKCTDVQRCRAGIPLRFHCSNKEFSPFEVHPCTLSFKCVQWVCMQVSACVCARVCVRAFWHFKKRVWW